MESDEAKKLTKHGEQAPSAYKYVLLCLSPVMRKGLLFPCNQIYGKVPLYKDACLCQEGNHNPGQYRDPPDLPINSEWHQHMPEGRHRVP